MNMVSIKHFFVEFMVSEFIPIVSVFGHCPYSVTFPYSSIVFIYMYTIYYICWTDVSSLL